MLLGSELVDMTSAREERVLVLFDIDGTLTPARRAIEPHMKQTLHELRKHVVVGIVGGSDMVKQREQLGPDGSLVHSKSLVDFLGNDKIKLLVNWALKYIADLDIPVKRGTFVEFRTGMINISPIGRNCSQAERDEFCIYDKEHQIVSKMIVAMKDAFKDWNLTFSIGGQISFDLFPTGWDKTYCLNHVRDKGFKEIHFFGDKTSPGGNDYEIFISEETIGHTVANPEETLNVIRDLWLK